MQGRLEPRPRGVFLAGDDVSLTAGGSEGAVQTALNALWRVMTHLGGATHPDNPGPGDRFAELAPVALPEDLTGRENYLTGVPIVLDLGV